MKLHVGSGPNYAEGWTNLDLNNFPGWKKQPDILASVFDMNMIEDETVEYLYCGHLLEHLRWGDEVSRALKEFRRVLSPTGTICVVGPCLEKAIKTKQPTWLLEEVISGWDKPTDPEGFPHRWTATTLLTRIALESVFDSDKITEIPITSVKEPDWPELAPAFPPLVGMWQVAFLVQK